MLKCSLTSMCVNLFRKGVKDERHSWKSPALQVYSGGIQVFFLSLSPCFYKYFFSGDWGSKHCLPTWSHPPLILQQLSYGSICFNRLKVKTLEFYYGLVPFCCKDKFCRLLEIIPFYIHGLELHELNYIISKYIRKKVKAGFIHTCAFHLNRGSSNTKHRRKILCNLLHLKCALLNRQTSSYSEYASIYSQCCAQHKPLQTKQIRFSAECSAGLRCWLENSWRKDGATWSHLKTDWIKVFFYG